MTEKIIKIDHSKIYFIIKSLFIFLDKYFIDLKIEFILTNLMILYLIAIVAKTIIFFIL